MGLGVLRHGMLNFDIQHVRQTRYILSRRREKTSDCRDFFCRPSHEELHF